MPAKPPLTVDQLFHLGLKHQRAGEYVEAIQLLEEVVARQPRHWASLLLLGVIAYQQGRFESALVWLGRSVAIQPNEPSTHGNLGLVLHAVRRFDEAVGSYQQAIALRPSDPNLHGNLGLTLDALHRFDEAIASHERAILLRPTDANLHYSLGNTLHRAGQLDQAMAVYLTALTLQPAHAGVLNNLGNAYKDRGDLANCIDAFRGASRVQPDSPGIHSNLLLALHYCPDLDPVALADEHRRWGEQHAGPILRNRSIRLPGGSRAHSNPVDPHRRLRIGYVSADYRDHAVARFLMPLITNHDLQRFELYAYSLVTLPDGVTERFRASIAHWRDITGLSDGAAADQIRRDEIDILVDLAGHTAANRLLIFAHRPAPLQVTYLGYPGSTGLREMDYRLTDPLADPPGLTEQFHTEQLLRIEPCAWCFQPTEAVELPLRGRDSPITFGSFNTFPKLNPPLFRVWSEILHAVPGSHLLLKSQSLRHPASQQSVLERLSALGITAESVTLRTHEPSHADHLLMYGQVDIALDTFPYAGTTTTCEALWMGSPVVTMAGSMHVSRVGASLLSVVGLRELIATTPDEYIQIAVQLANDQQRRSTLHTTLRQRVEQSPLMDGNAFARTVEAAYRDIWQRWCCNAREAVKGPSAVAADRHR